MAAHKEQPVDFAYSKSEFLEKKKELEDGLKKLKRDKQFKVVWEYKKPSNPKKSPWWEFYIQLR